jgi:hypothetical protein
MANCFTLLSAGKLVLGACPVGTTIENTLEEAGFITELQRGMFRESVFELVLAKPCNIQRTDIPNDGTTTIRQVRQAVFEKAGKPSPPPGGGA